MKESCLNCGLFLRCSYQNKRADYRCNDWRKIGAHDITTSTNLEDFDDLPGKDPVAGFSVHTNKDMRKAELDLEKTLSEVLDANLPVPKDLKVDDRDIPMMPNFWSFCFDKTWGFTGIKPFGRQMWIATKLFGEYCPVCTEGKIMKDMYRMSVKFKAKEFPEVVQLLEFGVCPKCKGTRQEFLKKKLLRPYSELAVCAGQRSGKSLFTSFLVAYINHKYLKLQKPAELYTDVANATLTATFVSLNFQTAVEVLWTPIVDAIGDSKWYCVAEGTNITKTDGTTVQIEEITPGTEVKTLEGSQKVERLFDNGIRDCLQLDLDCGKSVTLTGDHKVRVLSKDGRSLIWKRADELTEEDFVVIE